MQMIGQFLRWLLLSAILLGVLLWFPFFSAEYTIAKLAGWDMPLGESLRLWYLEQHIEIFRIIVVGVLAALASVLIPIVYSHAKARFERFKEARNAYSRAKTAVLYLPDRVLAIEFRDRGTTTEENDAAEARGFELIEEAHRDLHLAETFEKDIREQGFLDWYNNPKIWILHYYWRIVAVAAALRWHYELIKPPGTEESLEPEDAAALPSQSDNQMIKETLRKKLKRTSSIVDDAFGERGEKWATYMNPDAMIQARKKLKFWQRAPKSMPTVISRRLPGKRLNLELRLAKEHYLKGKLERTTIPGATTGLRLNGT